MKRILLAIIILLALSAPSQAAHIKGGFFTYEYLGPGSGTNNRYKITLTVYMICSAQGNPGQLNNPINFSIFNARTNQFIQDLSVPISSQFQLSKAYDEPCITGNETGCYYYIVVYDLASVELPSSPDGYTVAYQRCCRIAGIINISASGSVGNTFSITTPGTSSPVPNAEQNSSPVFLVNDTAVICRGSFFAYSFQASDKDSDSLSYEFCNAIEGATQTLPAPTTATNPPYFSVPYQAPFNGIQPMGAGVTINSQTGLISGTAPTATGEYVVSVCVREYRAGVLIGITRKELHIRVGDCDPLNAQLGPRPTTCDGFTVNFSNDVSNPAGATYHWTFGEPASGSNDTSFIETPTHTYTLAGTYNVRLRISLAGLCIDSADLTVNVFPGFFPGFTAAGSCITSPFQFTDTTRTDYGVVDSWSWNFGDETTLADTSHIQHPQWTYTTGGTKTVTLTVTNSKGCTSTVSFPVNILDKPIITLAFRDTLICRNDAVQLNATGTGNFSWTPPVNIVNANTGTPTVTPTSTTWYYVNLNDNGCINNDSVQVRVVNSVTLRAINDTTICQGDAIQLGATSDGLQFSWTPVANLDNPNIINPTAITNSTTIYNVVATIGSCTATDQVVVTTVPYPGADAGPPQTICYNTSAQLNGSIVGIRFEWQPITYLSNPAILNPVSTPPRTTQYILLSYDTLGCPKAGRDTILVTVQPRVRAFAGNDTTVVVGQPLLFNGTGGVSYQWSPSTGLSSTTIFNPIGVYNSSIDSVKYKLIVRDAIGCPDSAFITVRVFKTNPSVFVPTAFTPNNDGLNDVVRPIAVGIRRINYFSIFNRWGQQVFTTTQNKRGWDGTINGRLQNNGVFVWMVSAEDYLGNSIFLKGTVTLIR